MFFVHKRNAYSQQQSIGTTEILTTQTDKSQGDLLMTAQCPGAFPLDNFFPSTTLRNATSPVSRNTCVYRGILEDQRHVHYHILVSWTSYVDFDKSLD